jgi:hypothetical protein
MLHAEGTMKPSRSTITEYLIFVAALVPTFLLVTAATLSLVEPVRPTADAPLPIQTAAFCEACPAPTAESPAE